MKFCGAKVPYMNQYELVITVRRKCNKNDDTTVVVKFRKSKMKSCFKY